MAAVKPTHACPAESTAPMEVRLTARTSEGVVWPSRKTESSRPLETTVTECGAPSVSRPVLPRPEKLTCPSEFAFEPLTCSPALSMSSHARRGSSELATCGPMRRTSVTLRCGESCSATDGLIARPHDEK